MTKPAAPRVPIMDSAGKPFGELDFRAADHIEVILLGGTSVRVARSHFAKGAETPSLALAVRGEDVFVGKGVTTIDGIDLGRVAEVVRGPGGAFETLVVAGGGEAGALAVPVRFVREVSSHIILEPSEEEVRDSQGEATKSPAVRAALGRLP